MANTSPIKYSDLIQPDNSIQDLISQLEEAIATYGELRQAIQSDAAAAAKAMQGLSGATDEQRQSIEMTARQAEELAEQMKAVRDAEIKATNDLNVAKAANKEYNQILKLQAEISRNAEGSYNRLSAQYRLLKIQINAMGEADDKAIKKKREMEVQARKLYEQMSNLQKATGKYTLEVGHYENALKAIPGPLGKIIGMGQQWRGSMAQTKEAVSGLAGSLGMSTNGLMAVMAGTAAAVAAVVGAFKLWKDAAFETQVVGDELNRELSGLNSTWDYMQKAIATFDFSNFISGAQNAMRAGRELYEVLDESYEREWSIRIRRAKAQPELESLREALNDQRKTNAERIQAGQEYLDKLKGFYDEEKELLQDIEKARLDELFATTNRTQYKTEAEEEAAKEALRTYIVDYNITRDRIENAKKIIKAEDDIAVARTKIYGQNDQMQQKNDTKARERAQAWLATVSDDEKAFAAIVRQYGLTSNKQLEAYNNVLFSLEQSESAFQTATMRTKTRLYGLEARESKTDGGGGGETAQAWSLQNDKKYQEQRLELLRKFQAGEIATREEFNTKVSELEIETLQRRLNGLKANSSERGKIEAELIEKQMALREKLASADQKALDAEKKRRDDARKKEEQAWIDQLNKEMKTIDLEIAGTAEGTDEMYRLRLAKLWKAKEIEIAENSRLTEEMRQNEALINAKYDKQRIALIKEFGKDAVEAANDGASEGKKKYGDLWDVLGINMDDDRKAAFQELMNTITESISSIISSWEKAAEASVQAADKQVESAQRILDSEREAAANGYANNVRRAEKELALAKKQREAALKEQEKAQKAQLVLDSISQAASLTTASANLWSAFSPIPYVGPALAIAAIATMWGSFLASKIKAAQVTKAETYGEGTVELLEGGSHASGHDISLGRKSNGVERRAEGGEYFAVINKRSSRRYRDVIPDVINSLNDGTFADKYQRANSAMAGVAVQMLGGADLTKIEKGVDAIREQGEERRTYEGGYVILRYKNLTRKIKS